MRTAPRARSPSRKLEQLLLGEPVEQPREAPAPEGLHHVRDLCAALGDLDEHDAAVVFVVATPDDAAPLHPA